MTWLCGLFGHKMGPKGACVRCWPDGVPPEIVESMRAVADAIEKYQEVARGIKVLPAGWTGCFHAQDHVGHPTLDEALACDEKARGKQEADE